jgi:hypothetical protein
MRREMRRGRGEEEDKEEEENIREEYSIRYNNSNV